MNKKSYLLLVGEVLPRLLAVSVVCLVMILVGFSKSTTVISGCITLAGLVSFFAAFQKNKRQRI